MASAELSKYLPDLDFGRSVVTRKTLVSEPVSRVPPSILNPAFRSFVVITPGCRA